MTKGLSNSFEIVAAEPLMHESVDTPEAQRVRSRAKLYRYTYVRLTTNEVGKPAYVITMSNSSTFIDNLTRQLNGDKFFYGEWVADFPRNERGNVIDVSEEQEVEGKKKPKSKVKA